MSKNRFLHTTFMNKLWYLKHQIQTKKYYIGKWIFEQKEDPFEKIQLTVTESLISLVLTFQQAATVLDSFLNQGHFVGYILIFLRSNQPHFHIRYADEDIMIAGVHGNGLGDILWERLFIREKE
jgi:hypothetical protein